MVDGGVFPQGAQLVDNRDAEPAANAQRGNAFSTGECAWSMSASNSRAKRLDAPGAGLHLPQIANARQARGRAFPERRAMKAPAVDVLDIGAPPCRAAAW
jgi:hypothetical protein